MALLNLTTDAALAHNDVDGVGVAGWDFYSVVFPDVP